MRKTKLTFLVCSALLLAATLYFWTLFMPPLSELEGANTMAQLIVFVPTLITYPIIFPLIWLLQIRYFSHWKNNSIFDYAFLLSSLVIPIIIAVIYYTIGIPFLILYVYLSLMTLVMTITSLLMNRTDR